MNFRKTSEWGGGVISDPKIFVAVFSVTFLGEKGGVTPIRMNFVANFWASRKKRNIVFRNEGGVGGGGSEAVWKFSENSLNLVQVVTP